MMYVLMGIMIFMLGILYFQVTSDAKYRDDKLFLITINKNAYESEEVQQLQRDFIRKLRLYYACLFIIGVGLLFLCAKYAMLVFIAWLVVMFLVAYLPLKQGRQKLKDLKKLRHWPVQIDQEVHVDLALSSYMEHVKFSKYYFVLPFILIGTVIVFAYLNSHLMLFSVSLIQLFIFIIGLVLINRIPNKTYCDSTEVNIQINTLRKKAYYRGFLFMCLSDACFMFSLVLYWETLIVFLVYSMMLFIAIIGLILAILQIIRFQEMHQRIIENSKQKVYHQDCDEYWRIGFFGASYNNPNDPHAFVSSPNGMQAVPNMAKPMFKYGCFIGLSCVLLFFGYLFGYPYMLDVQGKLVDVSIQNQVLRVDSAFYEASWNLDEIIDVELVDDLGNGSRVIGTDAFVYKTGNFVFDRYGKCKVYLASLHANYIVLHTVDETFIINDDDETQTETMFHLLEKEVKK